MWYLITAIISSAVGAFFAGFQKGQEHERKHPHDPIVEVSYDHENK